jgi:hypothetical protein
MTEQEWDASEDPNAMLAVVDKPENARELRLFAVALYHRHRRWLKLEYSGDEARPLSARAIRTARKVADGLAKEYRLESVGDDLFSDLDLGWSGFIEGVDINWQGNPTFTPAVLRSWAIPDLALAATTDHPAASAMEVMTTQAWRIGVQEQLLAGATAAPGEADIPIHNRLAGNESALAHQRKTSAELCDLFRELFGNPFHPVTIGKLQVSDELRRLAQGTYEKDKFDELPILADALEEAGCTNSELLAHLRSAGPHARGCWALDAALDATAAKGEWAPSRPRTKKRKSEE